MSPLISIIIPAYNVEKYLHKCIDGVLSQTYTNLEIILVDDGSQDNCGAICDKYAVKDNRIKVIHKDNGGLSSARNAGLDIAQGEWIGFIDSDDYVESTMFEKLYDVVVKEEADLAICSFKYLKENGNEIHNTFTQLKDELLSQDEAFSRIFDNTMYITTWNKLYKRNIFDSIRFPEGKIHEDEFIIHHVIEKCKKIVTISDALYMYIQRNGSIMSSYTIKRLDAVEAAFDRYEFFKNKDLKHLSVLSIRCAYGGLYDALQNLDLKTYKSIILPLYKKIFYLLLENRDLRFGKLFLGYCRACLKA